MPFYNDLYFAAVINALDSFALDSPTEFLDELGRVLGKMGGTSGGIYSLFLTAASAAFQVRENHQ